MRHKSNHTRFLAIFLVAGLSGCSETWESKTYPVKGTILINGKPPERALIRFRSVGQSIDSRESIPCAIVGPDGTFEVMTYRSGDGAPAGTYSVTLRWPVDLSAPQSPDRLKEAFNSVSKAIATVTIEAKDNVLPPIQLTGVELAKIPSKQNSNLPPFIQTK